MTGKKLAVTRKRLPERCRRRGTCRDVARRLLSPAQWRLIDDAMHARHLVGDVELAKIAGVSGASVSRWRSGLSGIHDARLRQIAAGLGIPYMQLADPEGYAQLTEDKSNGQKAERIGDSVTQPIASGRREALDAGTPTNLRRPRIVETEYVYYPVLGRANCGAGGGASLVEGEFVPVPTHTLRLLGVAETGELKLVEMAGTCMVPDIHDGDYALFDPNTVPAEGEIVCVTVMHEGADEGEHIVKRLTYLEDDRIALTPNVPVPGMPGRQEFRRDEVILEGVLVAVIHTINRPPRTLPMVSYRRAVRSIHPPDASTG